MSVAEVFLWGHSVGVVRLRPGERAAAFQYRPEFAARGVEISPLSMPLSTAVYSFPTLAATTFRGLPGLLADALPDRFGNTLLAAALESQGRSFSELDAVARLSYIGTRAMGALEFVPATGPAPTKQESLQVQVLLKVVGQVLHKKQAFLTALTPGDEARALLEILQIGGTAGGARAKAVINLNPQTREVRSGHLPPVPGFEPWLLKLDGVPEEDGVLGPGTGAGRLEYAYYLLARACNIQMAECQLLDEGGRAHFMTRRFDRVAGEKVHTQTLGALLHIDFSGWEVTGYERALDVVAKLGIAKESQEELFRRMVFNVVFRNQDDHVKNISFLMSRDGSWSLAPAYDLTWMPLEAPQGQRMSVNGKQLGIGMEDFRQAGASASLVRGRHRTLVDEVMAGLEAWPAAAEEAGLDEQTSSTVFKSFLTKLQPGAS